MLSEAIIVCFPVEIDWCKGFVDEHPPTYVQKECRCHQDDIEMAWGLFFINAPGCFGSIQQIVHSTSGIRSPLIKPKCKGNKSEDRANKRMNKGKCWRNPLPKEQLKKKQPLLEKSSWTEDSGALQSICFTTVLWFFPVTSCHLCARTHSSSPLTSDSDACMYSHWNITASSALACILCVHWRPTIYALPQSTHNRGVRINEHPPRLGYKFFSAFWSIHHCQNTCGAWSERPDLLPEGLGRKYVSETLPVKKVKEFHACPQNDPEQQQKIPQLFRWCLDGTGDVFPQRSVSHFKGCEPYPV